MIIHCAIDCKYKIKDIFKPASLLRFMIANTELRRLFYPTGRNPPKNTTGIYSTGTFVLRERENGI
jgi:hypothetical protein